MPTHRNPLRSYLMSLLLPALAAGCAAAADPDPELDVEAGAYGLVRCQPELPAQIVVPEGNRLAFVLDGVGQQLYECRQQGTGYAWVFQEPDADLLKENGNIAGTHYAGPTWEALDGSTVVAARTGDFTPDATAIAWLRLEAVSHGGHGRMSNVSYIQRLETTGGVAPDSDCDADNVGELQGVDYTTEYYFYVPDPAGSPACTQ